MGFFSISLEEINDSQSETIRYNALSHRLSKLEPKDFDDFMSTNEDGEVEKKKFTIDHQAQMKKAQRISNG